MSSCTVCRRRRPTGAMFCPTCGTPVDRSSDDPTAQLVAVPLPARTALQSWSAATPSEDHGSIVITRGPGAGSRYSLVSEAVQVGRHPRNDVLLDDVSVSRHHARIVRRSESYVLQDLGSLNGTYVNGERVEEAPLRHGDEVQVGLYKLVFLHP